METIWHYVIRFPGYKKRYFLSYCYYYYLKHLWSSRDRCEFFRVTVWQSGMSGTNRKQLECRSACARSRAMHVGSANVPLLQTVQSDTSLGHSLSLSLTYTHFSPFHYSPPPVFVIDWLSSMSICYHLSSAGSKKCHRTKNSIITKWWWSRTLNDIYQEAFCSPDYPIT